MRPTVELSYGLNQKQISDDYYYGAKKQMTWFKSYIKKILKNSDDVLFLRLTLGHRTKFGKIVTEYYDIDTFELPDESFEFEPLVIYQFVDNSSKQSNCANSN